MSEATPAPAAPPAPVPAASSSDAGKTLGIVGLVLAFVFALAGLIVSIIARSQSKKAGVSNTPATAGIIIGLIGTIILIIVVVVSVVSGAALLSQCAELGPGTYGNLTCS